MFGIEYYIKNINRSGQAYASGRSSFTKGASIVDCPVHGTEWDQAAWCAGWFDELADAFRKTLTTPANVPAEGGLEEAQ